jgi:hypothetical protein
MSKPKTMPAIAPLERECRSFECVSAFDGVSVVDAAVCVSEEAVDIKLEADESAPFWLKK